MKTLHYAGQPGEGFGWGVANANLIRELSAHFEMTPPEFESPNLDYGGTITEWPDVVFMPLSNHDLDACTNARGRINLAYTFFEYELGPKAFENAQKYDVVFCGSTWCQDRLRERGITNTRVLIQGVDNTIFRPMPRGDDGQFRIFSGGKFEYRKGQDLVIAAFREFAAFHPEAHLVCAWHNLWPQLLQTMEQSDVITCNAAGNNQVELFTSLLINNGLNSSQFTVLPLLPQSELAAQMAQTDIGLFPNRCEGGTNLVLMEYLSCGRPAAANVLTGHADIAGPWLYKIDASEDSSHWARQSVRDVVLAMDWAHHDSLMHDARLHIPEWTWAHAADTIRETVEALDAVTA